MLKNEALVKYKFDVGIKYLKHKLSDLKTEERRRVCMHTMKIMEKVLSMLLTTLFYVDLWDCTMPEALLNVYS